MYNCFYNYIPKHEMTSEEPIRGFKFTNKNVYIHEGLCKIYIYHENMQHVL